MSTRGSRSALAAVRTNSRIRLGTLLTPPSRRRPWELASQVATVDRLSEGRVTLSVGLGAIDSGFDKFGEECDRRVRAELLDEALDIVTGLWNGQPFSYSGKHYTIEPTEFPTIGDTVQKPRVPIWCVGMIGKPKSMARALRWDGLLPSGDKAGTSPTLDQIRAVRDDSATASTTSSSRVPGSEHSPAAWARAGATWWIESMWNAVREVDAVARRQRPPDPGSARVTGHAAGVAAAVGSAQTRAP